MEALNNVIKDETYCWSLVTHVPARGVDSHKQRHKPNDTTPKLGLANESSPFTGPGGRGIVSIRSAYSWYRSALNVSAGCIHMMVSFLATSSSALNCPTSASSRAVCSFAPMSRTTFLCSEVFSEPKASLLRCLLLSRRRSAASTLGLWGYESGGSLRRCWGKWWAGEGRD